MDLGQATIAVTGATGFLGRYLARALLARGATVVGVVRNPNKVPQLSEAGVHLRVADLSDRAALTRAFQGVDAVLSNAGLISVGEHGKDALMHHNVTGTANVMMAMVDAGVQRVVMTSSATVYRPQRHQTYRETDPLRHPSDRVTRLGYYALSKAAAERRAMRLAEQHDLHLTTFRPHAIHGAFDDHGATAWLRRLTRQPIGIWLAGTRFPSVYAGDLAEAVCRMLECPEVSVGQAYNIAGEPDAHTFWDLLHAYREAGGDVSPLVVPLPAPMRRTYVLDRARQDLDFENRPLVDGFREMLQLEQRGGL